MKSIKLTKTAIIIKYATEGKAQKLYDALYPFEQKRCTVENNTFIYDLTDVELKHVPNTVKSLYRKSTYKTDVKFEEYIGDTCDALIFRLNTWINGDKLFRITPLNSDGTKGTLDFGSPYQYSRRCDFILTRSGEFFVNSRGTWFDDKAHCIDFNRNDVLIEIGDVQF